MSVSCWERFVRTNFASRQDPTDFSDDRFIAAQIRRTFENEAKVEPKEVSLILSSEGYRKSNDAIITRRTHDEATTERVWGDNIF